MREDRIQFCATCGVAELAHAERSPGCVFEPDDTPVDDRAILQSPPADSSPDQAKRRARAIARAIPATDQPPELAIEPDIREKLGGSGEDRPGTPDLADALDAVHAELVRFVAWPCAEAADAAALYIAATHAQPAWEHATRLVFKSPLKRCGKTRALEVCRELVYAALPAGSISAAALVRAIDEVDPPSLLLDEADTIFGRTKNGSETAEDLRGILNNGYNRGWPYRRWNAKTGRAEACPTFAMAILAAIGDLPDTIEDRAIVIPMRRRAPGETVTPWRTRRDAPRLRALRERLHEAVRARLEPLAAAEPEIPAEDRVADCWEPLLAVADAAGGSWPARARRALVVLEDLRNEGGEGSASERLLADLREVWGEDEAAVPTADLLERLHGLEEAPWGDWYGRKLAARDLARLLRPYGVRSRTFRLGASTPKGYLRADLEEVWARYVAPSATSATAQQAAPNRSVTSEDACCGCVADGRAASATADLAPEQCGRSHRCGVADVADTPRDGDMGGSEGDAPTPGPADVLGLAEALGWPRLKRPDGEVVEGEAAWRRLVEGADGGGLAGLWEHLANLEATLQALGGEVIG